MNNIPFRYDDSLLKRYADQLERGIKESLEYKHTTDIREELLLELVRRELERAELQKGKEKCSG